VSQFFFSQSIVMSAKAATVRMNRAGQQVPWGFRLHGGADYGSPLVVQKVSIKECVLFL